jgi:hypothetical protein
MTTMRITHRTLALLSAMLLAACSSAPGPKGIPANAEFSTKILGDGSKLFTLKLHPEMGRGGPGGPMPQDARGGRGDGAGGDCFPCEPGEGGRGEMRGARAREADLKNIASAMIAENHYCRDGFVVLEQFQQDRSRVLRGECRDGADASDRARFSQ